jgi:hypothetical protein
MSSSLFQAMRPHPTVDMDVPLCLDAVRQQDLLRALTVFGVGCPQSTGEFLAWFGTVERDSYCDDIGMLAVTADGFTVFCRRPPDGSRPRWNNP